MPRPGRIRMALGTSLLGLLILMGPSGYDVVNADLHATMLRVGLADPLRSTDAIQACDPGWREVIAVR